ncbi:MAG: DUF126 domain-containing protein [Pseudomonadota bacterium]
MNWQAEVLFKGSARAEVLRLDQPISFWGGVDPVTSEIVLAGHPQQGQRIENKILVIPRLVGSSSSSAVMLELIYKNLAPAALLLGSRDAILPMGVLVAQQMQWKTLPVLVMNELPFTTGTLLQINADGVINTS